VFFLDPLNPIFPADDQEITSPALLDSDIIMLLKEAVTCAAPVDSTTTLRFFVPFVLLEVVFAISLDYLVAFFLLATVLRFPFLVLELFFVRCPLKGRPTL